MKKKTRNMMFGLAAVFVLAVAGVAVEALEEKTNELNWIL